MINIDSIKPTVCAFSSLFAIDKLAGLSSDSFTEYANDYCKNLETTITNKMRLINAISVSNLSLDFDNVCVTEINKVDNKWFDPIIPNSLISYGDMCSGLKQLYT